MAKWLEAADGTFLRLDREDHARFKRFKWRRRVVGRRVYFERNCTIEGKYVKFFLHREVMGAKKGDFVGFKSEDFTDLRRSNLVISRKRLLPIMQVVRDKKVVQQVVRDGRIYCPRCKDWVRFYEWSTYRPTKSRPAWRYCQECAKKTRLRRTEKVRRLVFDHYGRSCFCCGESHEEFLTIDHINDDGNRQRAEKKCGTGERFYGWIIRNGYPDDLRTCCYNCNIVRDHKGYCPHERERAAALAAAPCVSA